MQGATTSALMPFVGGLRYGWLGPRAERGGFVRFLRGGAVLQVLENRTADTRIFNRQPA